MRLPSYDPDVLFSLKELAAPVGVTSGQNLDTGANSDSAALMFAHFRNKFIEFSISKSGILADFTSANPTIGLLSGARDTPRSSFNVPGLHFRKLTSAIHEAFHSPYAHHIHFSPFRFFHKPAGGTVEECIYNEVYTSDAFIEEHKQFQRHGAVPPEELDCKLEKLLRR